MSSGTGIPLTVVGPGGDTFDMEEDALAASGTGLSVWRVKPTVGGTGNIVITWSTLCVSIVHRLVRIDGGLTTGTNGADAVVQKQPASGADPLSATLGSAITTGNLAYAMSGASSAGAQTCTWDAGYTEQTDRPFNMGGWNGYMSTALSVDASDPTPTATWSGTNTYGLIVLELAAASTGSSFAAAASVGLTASGQAQLSSQFSGSGTVRTTAAGAIQVRSSFSGAGQVALLASSQLQLASSIAASASLGITSAGQIQSSSQINGASGLSLSSSGQLILAHPIIGAGSLSLNGASILQLLSALTCAGSFSLTSSGLVGVRTDFAGSAAFGLTGAGQGFTSAAIAGAGSFQLSAAGLAQLLSALSAVATVQFLGAGNFGAGASLAGAGTFGLSASGIVQLESRLSGAGSFVLSAASSMQLRSALIGAGALGLTAASIVGLESFLASAGFIDVSAAAVAQLESQFSGNGSFALTSSGLLVPAVTEFIGQSEMRLSASVEMQLLSAIAGAASVGLVTLSGAQIESRFGGAGSLWLSAAGIGNMPLIVNIESYIKFGSSGQLFSGFVFAPPGEDYIVFCEADSLLIYDES